jgi:hypothetical protein
MLPAGAAAAAYTNLTTIVTTHNSGNIDLNALESAMLSLRLAMQPPVALPAVVSKKALASIRKKFNNFKEDTHKDVGVRVHYNVKGGADCATVMLARIQQGQRCVGTKANGNVCKALLDGTTASTAALWPKAFKALEFDHK